MSQTDMTMRNTLPVVMAFSGNDPTGGAGIQADIEAAASMGAHVAPIITSLTVQDSQNVKHFTPTSPALISEQARVVLEDISIDAFKIGMLGSIENIQAVHNILHEYPHIPVILDPIISAGGGKLLSNEEMALAFSDLLFPLTSLVTPNSNELRWLAPEADSLDTCAQTLMDDGCQYVLLTGTHEDTKNVNNILYGQQQTSKSYQWPRLPHSYHGSGCTLTSAIAALIALGETIPDAVEKAQQYTWNSLKHGRQLGRHQYHPQRFFWKQ